MTGEAIPSRDYDVELSDGNTLEVYADGVRKAASLAEMVSDERALKVKLRGVPDLWVEVKGRCEHCWGIVLGNERWQVVNNRLRCEEHRDERL